ncbi:ATP-binding protein [Tunturiibacter gelidiferens]|uniref:ATP-binding protein n=1 Tax=Tunturiibacter gelidiferens TaxID=3069689 RepID=UPI003D9BDAE6
MDGKNVNSIELRLPSRLGFEKIAMSTASSVAKLMGFAPDRVEDLKTAVAEACINAMEHGNKLDESLIVGVILSMNETSLEVKVLDTGTGPLVAFIPRIWIRRCTEKRPVAVWECFSFSLWWMRQNGSVRLSLEATRDSSYA